MPADVLAALSRRRAADRQEAQTLRLLLAIPVLIGGISMFLSMESKAFELAIVEVGLQAAYIEATF